MRHGRRGEGVHSPPLRPAAQHLLVSTRRRVLAARVYEYVRFELGLEFLQLLPTAETRTSQLSLTHAGPILHMFKQALGGRREACTFDDARAGHEREQRRPEPLV